MRNTLIGAGLAIILVAALFAASAYWRHPATDDGTAVADTSTPPAALKDDFVGETKSGAWKLVCNKGKEFPKAPSNGQTGNSEGAAPQEAGPPPGWKFPRCIVGLVLHNPKDPKDEVRVTFRNVGFKRVLALFVRFPPTDVTAGDTVKARFDATEWEIPVRSCPAQFCLAIASIRRSDVPVVENAKSFNVAFTPSGRSTEVVLPLPVAGLGDAIKAMKRLNH
ncbi:MAG TPA: invasion associated locus B family protein [Rhizomicrobium sp.]|nr:invasion associated locus B family protein [Rhizomicrobium sp.]